MSNILIATPIKVDAATVSTTNTRAGYAVTNLQVMQPTKKWRTDDVSNPIFVTVDMASATAVDTIALIKTNATSSATFQVRAANSEASVTSNPDYDSGVLSHWPETDLSTWDETSALLHIASTQTYRYFRIDIVDTNNSDGFYEVGRLIVTKAWEPSKNDSWGRSLSWKDNSLREKSLGGRTFITLRDKFRVVDFSLDFLDEDEMYNNAFEIDRQQGSSKDVLIVFDASSTSHVHKQMIHGLIDELTPIINSNYQIFKKRYKIEELL